MEVSSALVLFLTLLSKRFKANNFLAPMPKVIHFVSGLPFACSTLLVNIMAQNPRVHGTATSMLHDIGYIARPVLQTEEAKCYPDPRTAETMLADYIRGGCACAFDSQTDRPVVVDKGRAWVGHLDATFRIWPDAKVIVPVRDIRAVLASMERRRRKYPLAMSGSEQKNRTTWATIEGRCQAWLSDPPIGIAIQRISDAAARFRGRVHFVRAEELTANPANTMKKVWEFLGEDFDGHDFENVAQYTKEHEIGFPYGDHTIKPQVRPLVPYWDEMLGKPLADVIGQKFAWVNAL